MTILERILPDVRRELEEARAAVPLDEIRARAADARPPRDFAGALTGGGFGLIAEWKQRSPSMGGMRAANVLAAASAYEASPVVRAVSVLTNRTHFGGTVADLARIAAASSKPVLRKDFILDPYQVYAARAAGADAVGRPVCVVVLLPPGNSVADSAPVLSIQPPGSIQARAAMLSTFSASR